MVTRSSLVREDFFFLPKATFGLNLPACVEADSQQICISQSVHHVFVPCNKKFHNFFEVEINNCRAFFL